ncbi:MAG: hypothetical protein WD066_01645 [Planctomycetaceae bacterium]
MPAATAWPILSPDVESILAAEPDPIAAVARGEVAALVVRQAFPADDCARLVRRFVDDGLLYDSDDPRIDQKAIPSALVNRHSQKGLNPQESKRRRIDIGSSLGYLGDDKENFLAHSAGTHVLFERLFADHPDPVRTIYDHLRKLSPGKNVVTAYEPDGRKYGPAIFRAHYGGYTYGPHFDSVRNREQRTQYAVNRFERQLAGVLCLQNATLEGTSAQGILHRQFWRLELDEHLLSMTFSKYAEANGVENVRIELEAGDLYFFNVGMIHEVPGVPGNLPRIVLATFIGWSEADPEVMVWS